MNKIISFLKSSPALFYLVIFLLLIMPALLLFPAAEVDSQVGMGTLLSLVILANLASIFF
jgi:preprotein translocase subunit SecY